MSDPLDKIWMMENEILSDFLLKMSPKVRATFVKEFCRRTELASKDARIALLEGLLNRPELEYPVYFAKTGEKYCAFCGLAEASQGHTEDCELAAALKKE